MLSKGQDRFYWSLWAKVKRRMMNGRETWTGEEENRRRHEFHVRIFGKDLSHRDFTNAQFGKFKNVCLAFVATGGFDAEMADEADAYKRSWYALAELMRELNVDRNYVQGIVDHMDMHGRFDTGPDPAREEMTPGEREVYEWERELTRDQRPRKILDKLDSKQLQKVIVALRKQSGREKKAGRVYVLKPA